MTDPVEALRSYLESEGTAGEMLGLLERAWPLLSGGSETSMESWKVERIESPVWHAPLLTFQIERHGAIVGGGSTRAELQTWTVDLETGDAVVVESSWRQVRPRAARFDATILANELAELISHHELDGRLAWAADHSSVEVLLRQIPELTVGFKQTLSGRRQRFGAALDSALRPRGWERPSTRYVYRREGLPTVTEGSGHVG